MEEKFLTLIFANPSLRTRLSFETGMKKLGGYVNVLNAGDSWDFEYEENVVMERDKQEHIKEAARVISKYTDIIAIRKSDLISKKTQDRKFCGHKRENDSEDTTFPASFSEDFGAKEKWTMLKKDLAIRNLAKYSDKPVINMESNMYHPCQSMADMMTMWEHFSGYADGKNPVANRKYVLTWAPHAKPLPLATPHSQILTPAIFGMDVTLACPEGFELDEDVMALAKEKAKIAGGKFSVTNDQVFAFKEAEVIVAKSWASLKYFGEWEKESAHRKKYSDWMVNGEKMSLTNKGIFMHCLPIRRNVVATDEVVDGEYSRVIEEAENRMWIQMAIISHIFHSRYHENNTR